MLLDGEVESVLAYIAPTKPLARVISTIQMYNLPWTDSIRDHINLVIGHLAKRRAESHDGEESNRNKIEYTIHRSVWRM